MSARLNPESRPGIVRAALAGVAILLFGPVIAPFTTYDFGYARSQAERGSQSFINEEDIQYSIAKDSWSLTSGFFVAPTASVKVAQQFARLQVTKRKWDEAEFTCLVDLWDRESKWNVHAANGNSGAYGIPQALPGNKMRSVGADWRDNHETQIIWGLNYIADRYTSPCLAWQHSEEKGWY